MKKAILLLTIFSLSFNLSGQTLHALLFVNEKESGREIDRKADMQNMSSFYKDIANQIGYSFNLSKNSDSEFTAAEVNREINNLDVKDNDIVIFYYSGHGYNQGKDKWPTLNFKDKDYWFSDILKVLNQHKSKAKLMMCIADSCNKGYDNATLPSLTFNPTLASNMKALFTDFKGKKTILMSASVQGQYSWSDLKRGALFGISYRASIYELTDNSSFAPTWNMIHKKAYEYTLRASNNKQIPQFQIIHAADFNPFED